MLTVISPAKKLDMSPVETLETTTPRFPEDTRELVQVMQQQSVADLRKLMTISENLAQINAQRYTDFSELPEKVAVLSFAGDTYQGLEADTLDEDALRWAQSHLSILSGLYGLLRPFDMIRPYRLEMGSRLKTERGKNLYQFWGDKIALALNAQARAVKTDVIVNCASQEYFNAVNPDSLKPTVITPAFYELKDDKPKIVSFYAKRARGAMARYIVENQLTDVDALKDFDAGGYTFRPDMSDETTFAFLR